MNQHPAFNAPTHVFRIDKFIVPTDVRAEFLARVSETHALLRTLPGFVRDWIFEQTGGPGRFNLVTTVKWTSEDAVEQARRAVLEAHRKSGFDAASLTARLGVTADVGAYAAADMSALPAAALHPDDQG